MLVVMNRNATREDIQAVLRKIEKMGYKGHPIPGSITTSIGITGNQSALDPREFEMLPGVDRAVPVTQPYKLVSRQVKQEPTVVDVGGVEVGGREVVVMAGPCAVESAEQTLAVARAVKEGGAKMLRGGAYKPRTSPYSFQGLGEEGLRILSEARKETGLPVVTEAVDERSLELVAQYADCIQIGARNMQNFELLKRAGRTTKPVLLKRGMSATIDELLMCAEYIMNEGNYNVILCERGVRTFANHTRNTLDLSVVTAVRSRSHLPVVIDPSHGTGRRPAVTPLARAGVAVGADGLLVEVHCDPDEALSDGPQSLYPHQFRQMMDEISRIAEVIGRFVGMPEKARAR